MRVLSKPLDFGHVILCDVIPLEISCAFVCTLGGFKSRNVPHYHKNKANGVMVMREGHVFTVEPMNTLGSYQDTTWDDNWTAVTADGKRSAQFEHTVLVTKDGCKILTARENEPVMKWDPDLLQR